MRFEFTTGSKRSTLRAIFEDGDRYKGRRQQGPHNVIVYSGDAVTFDYPVRSIHPDLLGLLCLIIFYPFIGRRVVFPLPVSPRLEQAFRKPRFERQFHFANVDPGLEVYAGSKLAISGGGGVDSGAVRVMFPEAFVVHEAHLRRNGTLVPSRVHKIVQGYGPEHGRVVTSNQRYISSPRGWHAWPCCAVTALLLATDYDFGLILTGQVLEDSLLDAGGRYNHRFSRRRSEGTTGNYWQSAFNEIGLPMFSPVCGASGCLTMQLALDLVRAGQVFSCMARDGGACGACPKCFRKDVMRAAVDPAYRPPWDHYDRPQIHRFLNRRPLYRAHSFAFADRAGGLPAFIASRLADLPAIASDWPLRVHAGTFEFCAEQWRDAIRERALQHMDPMEPEHLAAFENWGPPPAPRAGPCAKLAVRLRKVAIDGLGPRLSRYWGDY